MKWRYGSNSKFIVEGESIERKYQLKRDKEAW